MSMDILVIGGGVGGLSAAAGLSRDGHRVRVFDRTDPLDEAGSGLVLSPNGVLALDRLDPEAGARVRAEAVRIPHAFPYVTPTGQVIVYGTRPDIESKWRAPIVTLRRRRLLRILLDALGTEIHTGSRLVAVHDDQAGAEAVFADGSTVRGDLLIAADGLWSTARRHLDPRARPRFTGMTSVRGIAPATEAPFPGGFCTQGAGVQLFAPRMRDGSLYWAATVKAPEGEWPKLHPAEARSRLTELVRTWHRPVPGLIAATPDEELVLTDIHDMPPPRRWSTSRMTLLGDAAHPMSPFLGQGANAALEDAAVLRRCLRDIGDPGAALAAYEAARLDRTTRMTKMSRQIGQMGQWENRLAIAVRQTGLRLAIRLGGEGADRWLYGYETG